mgnify:CR=1 FL=1
MSGIVNQPALADLPRIFRRASTQSSATETAEGIAEIATVAEANIGTDDARFLTPLKARFTKGGDITSADPLVLNTDGNYFDVTGSINFTSITVAIGRFFILQFDAAVTLIHNATTLDLPGEANITVTAGDSMMCFATGTNQVHVLNHTRAASIPRVLQNIAVGVTTTIGTTIIPDDDTPPTANEGTQILSQVITMADNANTVRIHGAFLWSSNTSTTNLTISCFRGSTLIGTMRTGEGAGGAANIASISFDDSPATSGNITYGLRVGLSGPGTWRTNQISVARYAGNLANSRIIIEEIEA